MPGYRLHAQPTKYAARPVVITVEGLKARNKWIKLYKANGWRVTIEKA